MQFKKITKLIRKEGQLDRSIRRKSERYMELVEAATSTGSFRYDQEKVTGSSPDGSRQERLVTMYIELGTEIEAEENKRKEVRQQLMHLIGKLPPRERRIMKARHIDHMEVEEIMKQTGISYETYKAYHHRAMNRLESMLDNVHQI